MRDKRMLMQTEHSIKRKPHFDINDTTTIQQSALIRKIIQFASVLFQSEADQEKLRSICMLHWMIEVRKSIFYVIHYGIC